MIIELNWFIMIIALASVICIVLFSCLPCAQHVLFLWQTNILERAKLNDDNNSTAAHEKKHNCEMRIVVVMPISQQYEFSLLVRKT